MTRDDIIRMAREAGLEQTVSIAPDGSSRLVSCPPIEPLERFANLVAAAEREACAQIAHDTYEGFGPHAKGVDFVKQSIMRRIRERGAP
jgi:hypothetical protein